MTYTNDPNIRYSPRLHQRWPGNDLVRPSKTTDGGVTWTPLAADPTGGDAFYLYGDPQNTNRAARLGLQTRVLVDRTAARHSRRSSTPPTTNTGLHIAGAFFDGNNIYVGTNKGLCTSVDERRELLRFHRAGWHPGHRSDRFVFRRESRRHDSTFRGDTRFR